MTGKFRRFTPSRWKALAWYRDYILDPNSVMGRKVPTVRMKNHMIAAGQLHWVEGYLKQRPILKLTELGERTLASKHKWFSANTKARLRARQLHRSRRKAPKASSGPETGAPTS